MRMLMLTASTIVAIAGMAMSAAPTFAADIYAPSPSYGPPPPQAYGPPPAPAYGPPPVVAYGPPPSPQAYYAPPPAYDAPGYPPGSEYEQPIYVEGQPYYRECWWDWGRRHRSVAHIRCQ